MKTQNSVKLKDFFAAIGRGGNQALRALVADDIELIIPPARDVAQGRMDTVFGNDLSRDRKEMVRFSWAPAGMKSRSNAR